MLGALHALHGASVYAQAEPPHADVVTPSDARSHGLGALSEIPVPKPDLSGIVRAGKDRELAQLGKMLFWDVSLGSDGMACASCHFQAGADKRTVSTGSPGLLRVLDNRDGDVKGYHDADGAADLEFETIEPGEAMSENDFPLVRFPGQLAQNGGIVGSAPGNSNDIMSSPGVIVYNFNSVTPKAQVDDCDPATDTVFSNSFGNTRRVPPRNSPTTINAVFNAFNFWDGRANPEFNGINPFGVLDESARVLFNEAAGSGGVDIQRKRLQLKNSSLASQAVGPVLSTFEESCDSGNGHPRTWFDVGKKMVRTDASGNEGFIALASQSIDRRDSLIGEYSRGGSTGATIRYRTLIEEVFEDGWWKAGDSRVLFDPNDISVEEQPAAVAPVIVYPDPVIDTDITDAEIADPGLVEGDDDGRFTLMEMNFSMFFGLAVQAYEQLLVSDDSPFDRWMRGSGGFVSGFGADELAGLNVFLDEGKCVNCHSGTEFTNASVRNFQNGNNVIEPMIMGDDEFALYDNGFYNIGVSPTVEDIGRGHQGPNGIPLASSRQRLGKDSSPDLFDFSNVVKIIGGDKVPNHVEGDPSTLICNDVDNDGFCSENEAIYPEFRRAAVDGAFKASTLRNVELTGPYFHNGSVITLAQLVEFYDNGGNFCDFNRPDLDPDIEPLGLSDEEKRNLVKFMLALTDDRVRYERAPFDHPSLKIPNDGAEGSFLNLRAVGSRGVRSGDVLRPVLNVDHFDLGAMPTGFECTSSSD